MAASEASKRWNRENRERCNAANDRWVKKDPERAAQLRRARRKIKLYLSRVHRKSQEVTK
jgi:hypothetical protein